MSQTYGMPMPSSHHAEARNAPVRYVVIIEGNGSAVARLMLETRAQVEEFEGGVSHDQSPGQHERRFFQEISACSHVVISRAINECHPLQRPLSPHMVQFPCAS